MVLKYIMTNGPTDFVTSLLVMLGCTICNINCYIHDKQGFANFELNQPSLKLLCQN